MLNKEWVTQIFQVVCVVHDLDETLGNWKRLVEFDQASIKLETWDGRAKCRYKGKEVPCPTRSARFDLGGVDLKLVEPLNKAGGDPYSDCLLEKGQGFHHIGVFVESYEELIKRYEELGIRPAFEQTTGEERCLLYAFDEQIGMPVVPWNHMVGPCGERDARGRTR